jgi:DNA adenine methylase
MQRLPPPEAAAMPILRWAGSKRAVLPLLSGAAPRVFTRYFEPFCGSARLFLALRPAVSQVSDINVELIACYRAIRRNPRAVFRRLVSFPLSDGFYYELRSQPVSKLSAVDRAARFLYLNRRCFNGVYRTNRQGQFNVPVGRNTGSIPEEARIIDFGRSLRRAKLLACDFESALAGTTRGDFVYLDPPYFTTRPTYGEYGYSTFRSTDSERLVNVIRQMHARGVLVLLSYGGEDDVASQLPGFSSRSVLVRRHIAGEPKKRRDQFDRIIKNYDDHEGR